MFYIIEIQEGQNGSGTIVTPIKSDLDKNQAFSKYYGALMYAAISEVFRHTVMLVDGNGQYLARDTFEHIPEPEPEIEDESVEPMQHPGT